MCMLTEDQTRRGAGDDGVLDQLLASLTPDQLERLLDGLASLQDGLLSALESTA